MLMIFVGLLIAGIIVLAAGRIVLGWVLPRDTMLAIDRSVNAIGKLCFQLSIIGVAAVIVWAFWKGSQGH